MASRWRNITGLGLLLLALLCLAAPVAAALDSGEGCHAQMQGAGAGGEAPARCQWLTPTGCCEEGAAVVAGAPALAPALALAMPGAPRAGDGTSGILPAAGCTHPTSQRLAIATIVLRL